MHPSVLLASAGNASIWMHLRHVGYPDLGLAVERRFASILALWRCPSSKELEQGLETIVYDEALPQETFAFELPLGATPRGRAEPQVTTIDAAARLASFGVFKLDRVPLEWRVQAVYAGATERPTLPDSVTLLYARRDGAESLQIRETGGSMSYRQSAASDASSTKALPASRSGRTARRGVSRRS
jgi:hypothetical protein